ncbi:trimethylamine methyltransferase family protein [Chloroflexota bacterium]
MEAGLPMDAHFSPAFGGTSPATIAGSLVAGNSEMLSSVVLYQLIRPGTRVLAFYTISGPLNMKTGNLAFGDIGASLAQAAVNQLWRRYGLPVLNCAGGCSSSKSPDYQCAYEKAVPTLISALSGANLISFHGCIYGEVSYHPVQAILDDDVAGMIGRFLEGIAVNDETLAVDLINDVGPMGHFLDKDHTLKWWKLEQFMPRASDRLSYPRWVERGKKSCLDYARERMKEILATHKPKRLTSSQEADIERILEEARSYYKSKGLITDSEMAVYRESMKSPDYPYG